MADELVRCHRLLTVRPTTAPELVDDACCVAAAAVAGVDCCADEVANVNDDPSAATGAKCTLSDSASEEVASAMAARCG